LSIRPGERVLDVATGTGEVAARAARHGADVTAIDLAPGMLAVARQTHGAAGIQFDLGDAQALPYDDGAFDVVTSTFGMIFAPDHDAVARELARVCRDRIGLTVWKPNPALGELYERFGLSTPEGRMPFRWGSDGYAQERLGDAFDLVVEERTWFLDEPDGAAHWEFWSSSAPPFKAMVAGLDEAARNEFRDAFVAYCEQFRENGRVRVPREYLLILGRKR
jgi:SAM-dependent methyltransferase